MTVCTCTGVYEFNLDLYILTNKYYSYEAKNHTVSYNLKKLKEKIKKKKAVRRKLIFFIRQSKFDLILKPMAEIESYPKISKGNIVISQKSKGKNVQPKSWGKLPKWPFSEGFGHTKKSHVSSATSS